MDTEITLSEALDLISSTTVTAGLYGLIFTLYCLCLCSLYPQLREPDHRGQVIFTMVYTSIIIFCLTIFLALNARIIQLAYINHKDYPGGPMGYESSVLFTQPIFLLSSSLSLIVEILTTAIQVCRVCWRLHSGDGSW